MDLHLEKKKLVTYPLIRLHQEIQLQPRDKNQRKPIKILSSLSNPIKQVKNNRYLDNKHGWTYFLRFGWSLLTQRRRHDLPVLWRRPLDRMELQSLGPYFFTWFTNTSSSSAFHGPFLICSWSLFPRIFHSYLEQHQNDRQKLNCDFLTWNASPFFSLRLTVLAHYFLSSMLYVMLCMYSLGFDGYGSYCLFPTNVVTFRKSCVFWKKIIINKSGIIDPFLLKYLPCWSFESRPLFRQVS